MNETARGSWLAMVTVACWAILPITIRIASRDLDANTVTEYRFAVSALVLSAILAARRQLPALRVLRNVRTTGLLVVAFVSLAVNYVLYLVSFTYVSPTVANVVTQIGPLLLMVGGIAFFHETLTGRQKIGVALLVVGLLVFFNRRLAELAQWSGPTTFGTVILVIAGVAWAGYALAQRALIGSKAMESSQLLLLIYIGCALVLAPLASLGRVTRLSTLELVMLALSCANTLVAYGALVEALKHVGAARVGALLAVVPVASLIVTWATNRVSPGFFEPDLLNVATIIGALGVAVGSALTANG